MKKIIGILLLTSMVIADVPGAGRPNPSAFVDESIPILENLEKRIETINLLVQEQSATLIEIEFMIRAMLKEMGNLEVIEQYMEKNYKLLQKQNWVLDHSIYEECPDIR